MVVASEDPDASLDKLHRILRDAGYEVAIFDMAVQVSAVTSLQEVVYSAPQDESRAPDAEFVENALRDAAPLRRRIRELEDQVAALSTRLST